MVTFLQFPFSRSSKFGFSFHESSGGMSEPDRAWAKEDGNDFSLSTTSACLSFAFHRYVFEDRTVCPFSPFQKCISSAFTKDFPRVPLWGVTDWFIYATRPCWTGWLISHDAIDGGCMWCGLCPSIEIFSVSSCFCLWICGYTRISDLLVVPIPSLAFL